MLLADRGAPGDYDGWVEGGVLGWGWNDCLPCLLKLERDCDLSGPRHGRDGPSPVRRISPDRMSPSVAAVTGSLAALRPSPP